MLCVLELSLLQADWYSIVWTDHIYLSSSMDEHVGSYHTLATVNKAAVDVAF